MDSEAKAPDSDTDWQAIDIFVFSNGQQYSPPRKYHLQAEDINLWKSTLSFLAKTQYGPLHSSIDLYTIEGRKIADPLQLSNGGSYVAVQPPDSFIDAGYDKYLIKASRSWEKRQAKRNENAVESDKPKNLPNTENIKPMEEHVILKSRASSLANHDASTIIKPQLLAAPQRRSDSLFAAKQTERKKTLIQPPVVVRKITPSLLPPSNIRNSLGKKKDSIKSTVKISKPEERRSSCSSGYFAANASTKPSPRLSKTNRPPSKSRDSSMRSESILPKVQEAGSELKKISSIKVTTTKNDEKLSTNNADLSNVVENTNLILFSDLYQNPYREMPSISVNPTSQNSHRDNPNILSISLNPIPIPMQSMLYSPVREHASTAITENANCKSEEKVLCTSSNVTISVDDNNKNINNHEVIESININHNLAKNTARESVLVTKLQDEHYPNQYLTQNIGENTNVQINGVNIHASEVIDYNKMQTSLPSRRSLKVELPHHQKKENYVTHIIEESLSNEATVTTCKGSETIKVYNSSPTRSSTMTNRVLDSRYITKKIAETRDLPPTTIDTSLNDQYRATLKKGDVVNLKLNIEIENHDGSLTKLKENIIHTDKGSQSNINDQIITQDKSLLSLITKEFNNSNVGDNHRVIIVQYNTCKYCNEYNAAHTDKDNNNYVILLPIQKFEEIKERCHCNETVPEIQVSSVINSLKSTYSCTSLQIIRKPQELADSVTQNIYTTPDTKSIENVVMISRKKSVAINDETTHSTREPSKIIQEIDVKTQLITLSVESIDNTIAKDNNYTQTNWCDVLLEARLLSDGHYTFRLPPLELLKYYKLT